MSALSVMFATAVVLYPFWLPIWENRPILMTDMPPAGQVVINEAELNKVQETMRNVDVPLRVTLVRELAAEPIQANQALLLTLLKREREPLVLATILQQLAQFDLSSLDPAIPSAFFDTVDLQLRQAAIALYGQLGKADLSRLESFLPPLVEEAAVPRALRLAAWRVLAERGATTTFVWARLPKWIESEPDGAVKALMLQTAWKQIPRLPEIDALATAAAIDSDQMRLTATADPYLAGERLRALLQDPVVGVRIAALQGHAGRDLPAVLSAFADVNPAVRLAAMQALASFTTLPPTQTGEALLILLGDTASVHVARAAQDWLVTLGGKSQAVITLLTDAITAPSAQVRWLATEALLRLESPAGLDQVLQALPTEELAENLETGIRYLGRFAPAHAHGELLQRYTEHSSPRVRAAVAEAYGRLQVPGCEEVLIVLSGGGLDGGIVGQAAIEAMGRFPQMAFTETLLACLKATSKNSSEMRRNAAWAAGQLRVLSPADEKRLQPLAQRLVVQCLTPVIPGMEPMFEGTDVLGNAIFALVSMAKKCQSPLFAELAGKVLWAYEVPYDQPAGLASVSATSVMPDAATNSLAYQARMWLNNKEITTTSVPLQRMAFSCSAVP